MSTFWKAFRHGVSLASDLIVVAGVAAVFTCLIWIPILAYFLLK